MSSKTKNRDYLADNCKALLIILVVFCHLLANMGARDNSDIWLTVYVAIYTFHMPAFMFLSGVFAKNSPNSAGKAVIKLTALYIVMTFLVAGSQWLAGGKFDFRLLDPVYSAWYLLALIFMRALLPALSNVRYIIPILIALCLIAPMTDELGSFLSLSRLVYFLPFFMMGYFMGVSGIQDMRKKLAGYKGIILIACTIIGIAVIVAYVCGGHVSFRLLWALKSYEALGYHSLAIAMGVRAFMLLVAVLATASLLLILPAKKNIATYIGTNSLSVYILQAVIMKMLPDFPGIDPFMLGLAAIPASIIIAVVLAANPINKVLSYPGDLMVKLLLRPREEQR